MLKVIAYYYSTNVCQIQLWHELEIRFAINGSVFICAQCKLRCCIMYQGMRIHTSTWSSWLLIAFVLQLYHSRIDECDGDSDWHVFGQVLLASNTVTQPQFYHRNPFYADFARIYHCMGSMSFLTEWYNMPTVLYA